MFTRNAALAGSRLLASLPRTATALRTTFSRRPEILLRPLRQQRYANIKDSRGKIAEAQNGQDLGLLLEPTTSYETTPRR
jgi:hypothetical protein